MDVFARSRRLLLIAGVAVAACSPAKGPPVGVSNGGTDRARAADAAVLAPSLAGLPGDFRATWSVRVRHITSEHGRFAADVYAGDAGYAEDLFAGDASAGVYLLEPGDAGARFGVADPSGRAIADTAMDAGPSLDACTRCHASARDAVFPVGPSSNNQ